MDPPVLEESPAKAGVSADGGGDDDSADATTEGHLFIGPSRPPLPRARAEETTSKPAKHTIEGSKAVLTKSTWQAMHKVPKVVGIGRDVYGRNAPLIPPESTPEHKGDTASLD